MSWHIHEVYSWWCYTYWWVIIDDYLIHDFYILGTWLEALVYGTGWLQLVWHRLVHGWCTCLCWQIDIYWGFLPHLSWCWECKMIIAYISSDFVELCSIQLLLKYPRIEVHNKKKNSLWRWFVDDKLLIYVVDMYSHLPDY